LFVGICFVILVTSLSGLNMVPVASHNPSHGGGGTSSSSSLSLVLLNSTDGLPHYGQNVTFNPSTTVTTRPYVKLDCYQNGVWVYDQWAGFYAGFPWPWLQTFPLSSSTWTSGAADCTATLYYYGGKGWTNIMSTPIHVYA
jgi:hypothetical protein